MGLLVPGVHMWLSVDDGGVRQPHTITSSSLTFVLSSQEKMMKKRTLSTQGTP
jgi:hypothetical protein